MAVADFKINTSVQADRGVDVHTSAAITLQLENAPSIDVSSVTFSVIAQSADAPDLTLSPSDGIPSTPSGTVTFTMPSSGFHSYTIKCVVNNGKRATDRGLVIDADYTRTRLIAIRSPIADLRKTVPNERNEYDADGWSPALNELTVAVEDAATGSGAAGTAYYLEDATTALNTNGVPIRALSAGLGFVGTAVAPATFTHKAAAAGGTVEALGIGQTITASSGVATGGEGVKMVYRLPDGLGAATIVAAARAVYTTVIGASVSAKLVWSTIASATLTDWMTLSAAGALRWHAYGAGRALFDGSGNVTSTAITAAEVQTACSGLASAIAVNSQKITGLADGSSSSDAAAFGQIAAAVASYTPTSRTIATTAPLRIDGGASANLSANRTLTFAPSADVAMGAHGFTGCTSIDNAAGTVAIGATASLVAIGTVGAFACEATGDAYLRSNAGSIQHNIAGTVKYFINATGGRCIFTTTTPADSAGTTTVNLATSQNTHITLTKDTTIAFSGHVADQEGVLFFTQPNPSWTATLPGSGAAVEYDATILALGVTAIVSTSVTTRTRLGYTVLPNGRVYIHSRSVSATIP